jgi:hypothetical protein
MVHGFSIVLATVSRPLTVAKESDSVLPFVKGAGVAPQANRATGLRTAREILSAVHIAEPLWTCPSEAQAGPPIGHLQVPRHLPCRGRIVARHSAAPLPLQLPNVGPCQHCSASQHRTPSAISVSLSQCFDSPSCAQFQEPTITKFLNPRLLVPCTSSRALHIEVFIPARLASTAHTCT